MVMRYEDSSSGIINSVDEQQSFAIYDKPTARAARAEKAILGSRRALIRDADAVITLSPRALTRNRRRRRPM